MQQGVLRKRRTNPLSDYGRQLKEKQELKSQYHMRERQFKSYVIKAMENRGDESSLELLMRRLERRLDNVLFRMGFAKSRKQARQMVGHKHFLVNGKSTNLPSYLVAKGDIITPSQSMLKKTFFQNKKLELKKYQPPSWIQLDKEKMEATILGDPAFAEIAPTLDISLVLEFYHGKI